MPSQPLPDNPNISAPKYEPPPIDSVEVREGYEETSYEEGNLLVARRASPNFWKMAGPTNDDIYCQSVSAV